eukprot:CAMPEP_0113946788 /NCGR_PEP_ID=MMETSP1339-20121228/60186_1 /TAXON_ID=94617 /ORGANISM="Fibrocapsa japonica" /LENGTH=604 /DNA_ID=CAMNT_0000953043 /DNA_START=112 /DNA_END=1926 /DNA_ORIENTATION=- /assembly_acc=CAM_ASM_000762
MPALSSTMTEGKIVQWLKSPGDKIDVGDIIMVVESDKADMDVESFEDGYLAKIITPEGEVANVGAPVALVAKSEADISAVASGGASSPAAAAPAPAAPAAAPAAPAPAPAAAPAALDVPNSDVLMPALSSTMTEGKIVSWMKSVGDKVEVGDILMVVESDKADMDVESFEEGYLARIDVGEGEAAPVGGTVAVLAQNEADIPTIQAAPKGGAPAAAAPVAAAAPAAAAPVAAAPAPVTRPAGGRVVASGYAKKLAAEKGIDLALVTGTGPNGRITASDVENFTGAPAAPAAPVTSATPTYVPTPGIIHATPSAKKLAKEKGVDLATLKGTGNFGRIVKDDVLLKLGLPLENAPAPAAAPAAAAAAAAPAAKKAAAAPAAEAAGTVKRMTGMEKAVSKNMEANLDVPIFRVSRPITTDKMDVLYRELKPKGVSVSALLAKAVAMTLEKHPIMNAVFVAPDGIQFNDINVAMAVAIDGGLITPVLQKANEMDLYSLARKWRELVTKAQEKRLSSEEYSTGTFTITNLGMFGITQFSAILPPKHGAILAIGASVPTVVQQKNGFLGVEKKMTVTITADHRIIYGAHAAEFLRDLADLLENNIESLTK